jgi:molybdenum cofactor synthesis domain-containing protein
VPDEVKQIQRAVMEGVENSQVSLVITTGGTGLSPRDVTPDAIEALAHRKIPGFSELLRQDGAKHVQTAWLSRSLACVIDDTLVIALPGSGKAVQEGFAALLPLLPHALHTLKGGNHG